MTGTCGRGRCFNIFIAFNFFVPALLVIVFLCCKVFETLKVGSSTPSRASFPACFSPCMSRSRGRHSRHLACLRSHVLRASRGGRDEIWSEKRCFHNLQGGHLAWWSADNCGIFPKVNISETRKKIRKRNNSIIEKIM